MENDAIGKRILVVEDERIIRELIDAFLLSMGFTITATSSAREAIAFLQRERFDAIVSDIRMPDAGGVELRDFVVKESPDLAGKMLFIVGEAVTPEIREFLAASGCEWIPKPFNLTLLLAKVEAILSTAN